MKRFFLTMGLTLVFMASYAQSAEDYIVKTKGVKKTTVAAPTANAAESEQQGSGPTDFVGKYFKYSSLCEWTPGMKFMVMPEKYDLIVKTFCDSVSGKEVSSMSLRHKILIYKGHSDSSEGRARIYFHCQDDNKTYYYEVPNGKFDDYCYNKMGVPTLAYLGDVDIARSKLIGKTLLTKSTVYYVDTDNESDGVSKVKVPMNKEVVVERVGVGTRSFPVKIIVADANGNEFFQNVAISKTNSGMRDDEFVNDNVSHSFYGSFSVYDEVMAVSNNYDDYVGQLVYTKYVTGMISRGDGRERTVRVPKMTTFSIDIITPQKNSNTVILTLTEVESRRQYFKELIFSAHPDTVEASPNKDQYFGYIFAMGEGTAKETSQAARAAIRAGRVTAGMNEGEVQLAVGEPDEIKTYSSGNYDWIYQRSKGKKLIVQYGRDGIVTGYKTSPDGKQPAQKVTNARRSVSSGSSWQDRPGTPLTD